MADVELRAYAWFRRRPASWWVLLLKGPESAASGASLGRARAELAGRALEWARRLLDSEDALAPGDEMPVVPAPAATIGMSSERALSLARLIVSLHQAGELADALMPRPDAVFSADELLRAA